MIPTVIDRIHELNVQNAIKGEPAFRLSEILRLLSKERLSRLATVWQIPGRSKMNKEALADTLQSFFAEAALQQDVWLNAKPEEMELVDRLLKVDGLQDDQVTPSQYLYWLDRGLLFSFHHNDRVVYVLPEEIKTAYRRLAKQGGIQKTNDRHSLVLRYIEAAVNLYGAIGTQQLIDLFNRQQTPPLTKEELGSIRRSASSREQTWGYKDELFYSDFYESRTDEDLLQLLESTKLKPVYEPGADELLRYAESDYYEMTPQLERLKAFVLQNLTRNRELADDLIDGIQLACSMELPLGEVLDEFEHNQIRLASEARVNEVMPMLVDVYNHTRMWSNRGHKPAELGALSGKPPAGAAKVGRNDPCPCGSGKKYKKCCLA